MFDCHSKLFKFYEDRVRLKERRQTLWEYRDKAIERVKEGTKKLREKDGEDHPLFVEDFSQGSIAMHTINQAQNDDDHDIDHALVYSADDLSGTPKEAREFVAKALNEAGGNFKKEPEARTNAVTVWYQDNHHVDLAIYKLETDQSGGKKYVHAGPEWSDRDPQAITTWFNDSNKRLSPSPELTWVTVSEGQLRRLVRLFKYWSKSRAEWSLPSGLVLTALTVECYQPHDTRDDLAFINTLRAISNRIAWNQSVQNPTNTSLSLLTTGEHKDQLSTLTTRLATFLTDLENVLKHSGCTEEQALNAWGKFYDNDFWGEQVRKSMVLANDLGNKLASFEIYYSKGAGSPRRRYDPDSHQVIPTGMQIQFRLKPRFSGLYNVYWQVRNYGDEAERAKQIELRNGIVDEKDRHVCNEKSAFRGNHLMICTVDFGGNTYRKEIPVRIR